MAAEAILPCLIRTESHIPGALAIITPGPPGKAYGDLSLRVDENLTFHDGAGIWRGVGKRSKHGFGK